MITQETKIHKLEPKKTNRLILEIDLDLDAKSVFTQISERFREMALNADDDTTVTPNLEMILAMIDITGCAFMAKELWDKAEYSDKESMRESMSSAFELSKGINRGHQRPSIAADSIDGARVLLDMFAASFAQGLLAARLKGNDSKVKTYLIRNLDTKAVKIGKSINPNARLTQLRGPAGSNLEIVAIIDNDVERELHSKFKRLRIVGEWFRDPNGEIEKEFSARNEGLGI